jgi:hypothetical protein
VKRSWLALVAGLALLAGPAAAQSVTVDGVTVHYAALPGDELDADVARVLGIVRSSRVIVVNIAVREGAPGHENVVPAQVDVRVRDAAGPLATPRMRVVRDAGGEYHLGEVRVERDTRLAFAVEVRLAGRATPIRAVFSQDVFAGPGP